MRCTVEDLWTNFTALKSDDKPKHLTRALRINIFLQFERTTSKNNNSKLVALIGFSREIWTTTDILCNIAQLYDENFRFSFDSRDGVQ